MLRSPRITYTPRTDTTPETEIVALSAVYRLVLEASRKKTITCPRDSGDTTVRSTEGVSHVDRRPN